MMDAKTVAADKRKKKCTVSVDHRLAGRVAARLHAAAIGVSSLEAAHPYWMRLKNDRREYYLALAAAVIAHYEQDQAWAAQ